MQHNQLINIPTTSPTWRDYIPLLIVFGTVKLGTIAVCLNVGFTTENILGYAMGFFFLIFGMFKVLDLPMFAMGYREYDLIAKRLPVWGYLYPFIELALAAAYLTGLNTAWLNWLTAGLSAIIVAGVAIKLAKREIIHCVCLGNLLKIPLTYVSLIEYVAMGLMALAMLLLL